MSTHDHISVRPATCEDHESLVDLVTGQLAEHSIQAPRARLANAINAVLADPTRGLLLVTDHGNRSIGFAYLAFVWSLEHAGRAAWLEELYVIPEEREHGVGEALLHAAVFEARAAGCVAVDLEVDEAHQRAEHLYYRNGFIPLHRRRWVKRLDNSTSSDL